MPTKPVCYPRALPQIPAEGPLNSSQILDLGLHLNHEQRAVPVTIRDHIDPTMGPLALDLHLPLDNPSGHRQPPGEKGNAVRVSAIALPSPICKKWGFELDLCADLQCVEQPTDRCQVGPLDPSSLDP
jgi:hypothetical protein